MYKLCSCLLPHLNCLIPFGITGRVHNGQWRGPFLDGWWVTSSSQGPLYILWVGLVACSKVTQQCSEGILAPSLTTGTPCMFCLGSELWTLHFSCQSHARLSYHCPTRLLCFSNINPHLINHLSLGWNFISQNRRVLFSPMLSTAHAVAWLVCDSWSYVRPILKCLFSFCIW